MSKIQLPPKREPETNNPVKAEPKISEKKIRQIINKGGSPTQKEAPETDTLKNFNILVYESDLDTIGELCDLRPKKPGRVIGFSKKDWFLEAVQEKIARERKKLF
jgi:hypothetical protein